MRKTGLVADLVAVLLFVGIGRSAHDHGFTVSGSASTAWPFLVGLAMGWVAVTASRRDPVSLRAGLVVCVSTVAVGMVLRVVSGQGTAFAFVLVALAFLGAVMIGWRLLVMLLRRRLRLRSAEPSSAGAEA